MYKNKRGQKAPFLVQHSCISFIPLHDLQASVQPASKRLKQWPAEDDHKWEYALEQVECSSNPFNVKVEYATEIQKVRPTTHDITCFAFTCPHDAQALEWAAARTPEQIMKEREDIIKSLEWANLMQRESVMCEVIPANAFCRTCLSPHDARNLVRRGTIAPTRESGM